METKEQILDRLNKLEPDVIDRMKNLKLLKLKELQAEIHKYKDELLVKKFDKEQKLVEENLKDAEIERRLRRDKELHALKKLISGYRFLITEAKLEIEILVDLYFRNKS